jgi:uncharacterized membrane protein YgaE (UPF0421/DUF939 family)
MTKKQLINRTLETLSQLPQDKIRQINDFADYILKKYEEENIQKGAEQLMSNSKTFDFLQDEEDIYSTDDLKESFK